MASLGPIELIMYYVLSVYNNMNIFYEIWYSMSSHAQGNVTETLDNLKHRNPNKAAVILTLILSSTYFKDFFLVLIQNGVL